MTFPSDQHGSKERALQYATLTTALSLVPTTYVYVVSNSIVLLGDLLRCLIEFFAIFLSWMVVRMIRRGDRTFYSYGLGKLEQVASLTIASAMLFTFFVLALSAIYRLLDPQEVQAAEGGLLLALLSVAGNLVFCWHYTQIYKTEPSPIVESQAKLFRAKAFASLVVSVSLVLSLVAPSKTILLYADPVGSLVLGVFLLYSASGLLHSSIGDLVDRAVDEVLQLKLLRELVRHEDLYAHFHGLRTRRSGSTMFVEVSLGFDGDLRFEEVSRRCDMVAHAIGTGIPQSEVVIIPSSAKAHSPVD